MSELFKNLPDYLGWHMLLSAAAMAIGIGISIPLGIWASRRPRTAEYLLGVAGILQTVPTLALLAIMVPILNAIGFLPAFIALTLYSFLPILAATVTGLRGVDPSLIEAARGLGMNDWQMLRQVQLPLASPVILSGIRTATVLVVGTATLATPVGGKSLGNYIFGGLGMQNWLSVFFGCLFTALLAIVLDQVVHLLEIANARRNKRLAWIAVTILVVSVSASSAAPLAGFFKSNRLIVMNGLFTEQYVLGEVMKQSFEKYGYPVDLRDGVGETIQIMALERGQADVAVNYTGNVWTTMMGEKTFKHPDEMYNEICQHLESRNIKCLGKIGFQNNYVFAMHKKTANERSIASIADLKDHMNDLRFADDEMFFLRPEWESVKHKDNYDLPQPLRLRSLDVGLLYAAVGSEKPKVDVITAYSSDARIKHYDLLMLDDPKKALPTYDAILLVSMRTWNRMQTDKNLADALGTLKDSIPIKSMKNANGLVDIHKELPAVAARELLIKSSAFLSKSDRERR